MKYTLISAALVACSFDVPAAGVLKCEPDGACPMNYACVQGYCIPPGSMSGDDPGTSACASAFGAGSEHTCAVRSDGTAQCWGRNDFGQLGDQGVSDQPLPVAVAMLSGVTAIDGGEHHSCAIIAEGQVKCWGRNQNGQLGDGGMHDSPTPVLVRGVSGAVQLAIGDVHSCARLRDGQVMCWGNNDAGQLGDGTTTSHAVATLVDTLKGATALAAGGFTTCAVDGNRALWCWGYSGNKQLGDVPDARLLNATMMPIADVTGVAVGNNFICAMTTGGVSCAGGSRVLGTDQDSAIPVSIALPVRPIAITAGGQFACATDDRARLWCWGGNQNFETGDPDNQDHRSPILTPYQDVAEVVAGQDHLCVRTKANAIRCSGYNGRGQIGDGLRTTVAAPQPVPGLRDASSTAGGDSHTCATRMDKTVVCWGENNAGQLGDGTRIDRATPGPVESLSDVAAVALGSAFSCARLGGDGKVLCWGRNESAELGDGSFGDPRSAPRPVMGLTGVTQLSVAKTHACALAGQDIWCWGDNSFGQNGDGTDVTLPAPKKVVLGSPAVAAVGVAAGAAHTCAIDVNHKVWCWGANAFGQLGTGTKNDMINKPAQITVAGFGSVDQLVAHGDFTCARLSTDHSAWCWGSGGLGELGNEVHMDTSAPSKVLLLPSVDQLTAGFNHACAIKPSGSIACWGAAYLGQVGDGRYDQANVPVEVAGLTDILDIGGGDQHTCAVGRDGTVACWGDDRRGQLGDGNAAQRTPSFAKLSCK
jgi:alpha-tubulin suppressor-like RCC1 family protein